MTINSLSTKVLVGLVFPVCFISVLSHGHSGATGIVKERMDLMKEMGDANKTIGDMVKRKLPLDADEIRELSASIQQHAAQVPDLFPDTKDSREGHATEAKQAIWASWEKFIALSADLERESAKLAEIATGGDEKAIRKQYAAVAKTCRGCHKDFRRPKDE